ncbi:LytR/AlgR family response regulator transcription factor [Enterococcus quebecensis]|uniref:Two-component system response regulator n=1 Tax=Enterococcus quebecensis TaxID=903983 RepID=A0A1E5GU98_9ENTE|nr:LytTR family DNA-binding domain-containing protein [Enterococcus quebecensis]OEG16248.1 two-component system response regulator [Enterococcus quebecensis]OJG74478.1 hypothetical protein RV12_GL002535 [Enterococcus quebecensis]
MKISIVDDNEKILREEYNLMKSILKEQKILSEIDVFGSGEVFLFNHEEKVYDLILLDIEMPNINGLEIARFVRKKNPNVLIIFITSHLEYAIDSFELAIFRYIPKNKIAEKLPIAVKDAIKTINLEIKEYYLVQTKNRFQKIPLNDIMYIYKEGKNTVFMTENDSIKVRKALAAVYSELNASEFIYIDKGIIVNLLYIVKIENGSAVLVNGEIILVSRNHLKGLKYRINLFWEGHLL